MMLFVGVAFLIAGIICLLSTVQKEVDVQDLALISFIYIVIGSVLCLAVVL